MSDIGFGEGGLAGGLSDHKAPPARCHQPGPGNVVIGTLDEAPAEAFSEGRLVAREGRVVTSQLAFAEAPNGTSRPIATRAAPGRIEREHQGTVMQWDT